MLLTLECAGCFPPACSAQFVTERPRSRGRPDDQRRDPSARPAPAHRLDPRGGRRHSGHPTSSMSAADLMAVLMARHLRYDYEQPGEPQQRPPDLLQGPRLAARLRDVRAPPARSPTRSCSPSASSARSSRATPRRSCRGSTSPPARSARACRSPPAIALCARDLDRLPYRVWTPVRRLRDGRGLDLGGRRARRQRGPGQPRRDHRRQPARPARRDDARLGPRLLRQARRGRRLARDRDRRPRHRRDRPRLLRGARRPRAGRR